jgi:hypothetical protein
MTVARAGQRGKERARRAPAPSRAIGPDAPGWSPRSPVFIGLCSIVMAVPLAVLADAAGPSDDPKSWALALLVAATGVAWLARWRPAPRAEATLDDRPGRVLRWAVLASLGWSVITTAASIAPGQSLFGVFGRGMGLVAVISATLVFFLAQAECRGRAATIGLIDAVLLGSVPVCLLALGQAAGWDPFPGAWDPAVASLPVRSTFGQHMFLGSYLVIVIPLAVGRLDAAIREAGEPPAHPGGPPPVDRPMSLAAVTTGLAWTLGVIGLVSLASRWGSAWWLLLPWGVAGALAWAWATGSGAWAGRSRIGMVLLAALVVLQVAVVVVSRARGAFLAMLVGLCVVAFTTLARRRARKAVAAGAVLVVAVLLFLVLLNVPRSPLSRLGEVPLLSRLGRIADVRYGSPVWLRLHLWRGILSGWTRQLGGAEVVPGTWPVARSVIGYGLDTQLLALDHLSSRQIGVLRARGAGGWQGQYLVDRSHSALLDQLVTGGLVGAGLYLIIICALLAVGIARIRSGAPGTETSLRVGCLGAALACLVEGQGGIVTPTPLALFWLVSAVLASAPWSRAAARGSADSRAPGRRPWWSTAIVVGVAVLVALVIWLNSRWLVASLAYAAGARAHIAGREAEAYADFQRSRELAPWLSLPAEAAAYTAIRLAGGESTQTGRLNLLHQAESAVADARRQVPASASSWALSAQIAFAEARAGESAKLGASLEWFARAARLRPRDPALLAQWAWALLQGGEASKAREVARRAVTIDARRPEWLPWAVLARASAELGDPGEAKRAAETARRLAPPEARQMLGEFLPPDG